MFNLATQYIQSLSFPREDLGNLSTSIATFDDDAKFRVEITTVNNLEAVIQSTK